MRSETPPPPANLELPEPPASDAPTTSMLKGDINSGRTGDKATHFDAGLSPLGTDDEAAGNPASPDRAALARKTEAATPRVRAQADVHGGGRGARFVYIGVIVFIAAALAVGLWLGR